MAIDALGREVKVSLDELKAALLADVAQEEKNAQKTDEMTDQLKRLNRNLEKIVGDTLDKEITALHKLIKKVAKQWEDANDRRNTDKQAKAIGKAVAESMGGRGVDKTMTLGKALERSQRRFATAFGQIGKQFQKDFGSIGESIKNSINRLNPFKKMEKQGEISTNKFFASLREGWNKTTKMFQDLTTRIAGWEQAAINKIVGWWDSAVTGVSKAWNTVTSTVGKAITKTIDGMAGLWGKYMTPLLKSAAKPFKWIGSYLAPIGKALFGTVKDLFSIGKAKGRAGPAGAQNDTGGMAGGPTKREMEGEGPPVRGRRPPRVAGGPSDLCRCICRCIGKLLGVTKQSAKDVKQGNRDAKVAAKAQASVAKQTAASQAEEAGFAKRTFRLSDPRDQMIREEAMQDKLARRKQMWEGRGAGVRGGILQATSAIGQILASETPAKDLAKTFATFAAKTAGFVASKPLEILGNILEKQEIFGTNLAGLGPIIKFAGEALGGLAEGLLNLVLQPLAEEVGNFQDEMQAMYITRGSVGAGAGKFGDARNVLDTARGLGNVAKKEEEFKRAAEEVTLTGQRYEKIQKQHLANLRRGIRDETQLNRVHHIGLRTASQIGANAEQTGEMFADWKQKLGASNIQLTQMERGMLGIARTTGVFGDNLLRAAKASQQFMEYMRMSGTFTAKAANNIIGLMAEAEKRGVSQGMGNVLQVLQGSLLGEGGDERTRNLAIAGIGGSERVRSRMMTGTILQDRGAQRIFAENLGSRLNQIARQRFGKDLDRLSIEEKGLLDPMIRQMFGKGVEELNQIIQTFKERSKNFSERMEELNQGAKRGLTEREVQNQRQQLIFDTGAEILEDFNRALQEEGGDVERAFAKIRRSSEDLEPFMRRFNIDISRGGASMGDVLRKQAEEVRKRAEQQGLTADVNQLLGTPEEQEARIAQAMADLQRGDRTNFQNLQATLTQAEGKTREQMRQNSDPVTKIVTMLFKMEAYLRIISRSIINAIAPGVQDLMGHIEGVMDNAAVEFSKGTPEGRQRAVELIGEAIRDFPAELSRHATNITGQAGVSPVWSGIIAGLEPIFGKDGPIGKMIYELGETIRKNAERIAEAIEKLNQNIEEIIKQVTKWATIIGVGGILLVGIAATVAAIGGLVLLLTGGAGLVAALGLAAVAITAFVAACAYFINEINKIKEASTQMTQESQARTQQHATATARNIIDINQDARTATPAQLAQRQQEGAQQAATAQWAQGQLEGGSIRAGVAADRVLRGFSLGLLDMGQVELAETQKLEVEQLRIRGQINQETARIAGLMQKAANEADAIRLRDAELAKLSAENQAAVRIGLARDEFQAIQQFYQRQEQLAQQFNAASAKEADRGYNVDLPLVGQVGTGNVARAWDRTLGDGVASEQERTRLQAEQNANTATLIERQRRFLQTTDPQGNRRWLNINEIGEKLKGTTTEIDAAARAQFAQATSLRDLKRQFNDVQRPLREAYSATQDTAEGLVQTMNLGQQSARNTLAYEEARSRIIKGMMKDEKGQWRSLADVSAQYRQQATVNPNEAQVTQLTGIGNIRQLDEAYRTGQAQAQERYAGTRNYGDSIRLIENSAQMQASYEAARSRMLNNLMRKTPGQAGSGYATFGEATGRYRQQVLNPTDMNQEAFAAFRAAANPAQMEQMLQSQLAPLEQQYGKEQNIQKAAQILDQAAKIQAAYEEARKQATSRSAAQAQAAPAVAATDRNTAALESNAALLEQLVDIQTRMAEAQGVMTDEATQRGSLFVQDVALASLFVDTLAPALTKIASVVPFLPKTAQTAEDEMRLKNAEVQNADSDSMSGIESNTGATVAAVRSLGKMLGQIGRMLSKRLKNGDLGVSSPDGPMEAFFDEILNTEWPNARIGRKVGLEFDYTDIS